MRLVLIWSHLQIKILRFRKTNSLAQDHKTEQGFEPKNVSYQPLHSFYYIQHLSQSFKIFRWGEGGIKGIIKWESDQIGWLAYSHRSSVWPWTCISPWPSADPTSLATSVSSSVREEKGSKGAFQYYDWTVHSQPPRAQTAQRLYSVDGNFPPLSSHKSLGTGSYLSLTRVGTPSREFLGTAWGQALLGQSWEAGKKLVEGLNKYFTLIWRLKTYVENHWIFPEFDTHHI